MPPSLVKANGRIYPSTLYAIAADHNASSLTYVQTIIATGDVSPYFAPQAIPFGSPGQRRGRLTGLGYRAGFKAVDWVFAMTRNQYDFWNLTYGNGVFSAPVTICTPVSGSDFSFFNAIADLPETIAMAEGFYAYPRVPVHMTHLVPLL